MLKFIAMIVPFIKELFFDRAEEYDFASPHFNVKKWSKFSLTIGLLLLVSFLGLRLTTVITNYIKLEMKYMAVESNLAKATHLNTELYERIDSLGDDRASAIKERDAVLATCSNENYKKLLKVKNLKNKELN